MSTIIGRYWMEYHSTNSDYVMSWKQTYDNIQDIVDAIEKAPDHITRFSVIDTDKGNKSLFEPKDITVGILKRYNPEGERNIVMR